MALDSASVSYGLVAGVTPTGKGVSGAMNVGISRNTLDLLAYSNVAASFQVEVDGAGVVSLDIETMTATLTDDVTAQVETATIVAAAGITANGNVPVTITGAHVTGSPVTVQVPVTTALTTAAQIASAIANHATVLSTLVEYSVSPVSATIVVEDLTSRTNDPTLNIAIGGGLGITAAPTSANTTPGVAPTRCFRLSGTTLTQDDFEGATLPEIAEVRSIILLRNDGAAGPGTLTAEETGGNQLLKLNPYGGAQLWADQGTAVQGLSAGGTLEFTATGGLCTALVVLLSATA